jgi:sugar isomerase, kpsF/gutQ family|uniref:KpsF/GutQ family sugar-phosphate isomerase n=1 Tax=Roseburia sp. TaxID=2049040 RepID=UPI003FED3D25
MERDIIADIRKVFDTEIAELENVKNSLDEEMVKKIVTLLSQCDGKVVLSGMGKPGHIGRKISATMSSLGISSYFLHPAEALHGDLGTLSQDDVIIIISNSGETAEVCNMLPNIKMIGTPIIAMTSYPESTLAQYADYLLELPVMQEACALHLAPTSSTTAELVMGDALAVVLSEMKQFKKENFALYHPAGSLGRKLITKVSDLMHTGEENPIVPEGSTLKTAIYVMSKTGLGAVSIVDTEGKLAGLITDGDLKRYMEKEVDVYNVLVNEVMTKNPIVVSEKILAIEALRIMEKREKQLSVLPVVAEDGKVVGLIRNHDIIQLGIF